MNHSCSWEKESGNDRGASKALRRRASTIWRFSGRLSFFSSVLVSKRAPRRVPSYFDSRYRLDGSGQVGHGDHLDALFSQRVRVKRCAAVLRKALLHFTDVAFENPLAPVAQHVG